MNPHLTPLLLTHAPNPQLTFPAAAEDAPLVARALAAGYAFAFGHVGAPTAGQQLNPAPLIAALIAGWTWAEAVAVATPTINATWRPIGDPLAQLPLPQAGWEIFGPLSRLEDLDPAQPAATRRDDERSATLDTTLEPASPDPAVYLIRHLDNLGRCEAGSTVVRTAKVNGRSQPAPLAPIWPDADAWPVLIEDNTAKALILWDRPVGQSNVQTVQLLGTAPGQPQQVLATVTPQPHRHLVAVDTPLPSVATRLAWRVTSPEAVTITTPESAPIHAPPAAATPLQLQ